MGILNEKSFDFAVRVVKFSKYLREENQEYVLSKQVLLSGTSVGALVRESEHAESRADFVHKLAIAQKECNETLYWLELLCESETISKKQFNSLHSNADELMKLLTASIKTAKKAK